MPILQTQQSPEIEIFAGDPVALAVYRHFLQTGKPAQFGDVAAQLGENPSKLSRKRAGELLDRLNTMVENENRGLTHLPCLERYSGRDWSGYAYQPPADTIRRVLLARQEQQVAQEATTRHLTEILEEAAHITSQAARGLRPEGAPMSTSALVRSIQEHVNAINERLGQLRVVNNGR